MMKNNNSQFDEPVMQTCVDLCKELERSLLLNSNDFVELPDLIGFLYKWAVKGMHLKYYTH